MAVDGHLNFDTKMNTDGFEQGKDNILKAFNELIGELKKITVALQGAANVKISADTSQVEQAAAEVRQIVREIPGEDITVDLEVAADTSQVKLGAAEAERIIEAIPDEDINVNVDVSADTSQADLSVSEIEAEKEEVSQPVVIPVGADTSQAEEAVGRIPHALDNVAKKTDNVGNSMSSSMKKAGASMESSVDSSAAHIMQSLESVKSGFKKVMAAAGIAFSLGAVVEFGKKSLESAAEVNAANSQMSQAFRNLQGNAEAAMKRVADSSGIVETRLQGVGTSVYAFARTSGMDSVQALDMMEEALQVAADSAAYYDRSLEDTSDTLMSFLKGNYANDAALGLSATETTRNAAANKLYGKSFQELSEAQKQLTLLQMVKDANALAGAEGQAAREAEGWGNVLGNLKESWRQLMAVLGQPVLQVVTAAVQRLTEALTFLTEKAKIAMNTLSELTGFEFGSSSSSEAVKDNIAQSVEYQNDLTEAVEETAKAQDKSLAGFDKMNTLASKSAGEEKKKSSAKPVSSGAGSIPMTLSADTSGASQAIIRFVNSAQNILDRIGGYFSNNFGDIFGDVWGGFTGETKELYNTVSGIFDDIKSLGPPLAEYFQGDFTVLLQTAFGTIGEILVGLFDTFNMVFSDIWDIAAFPCLSAFVTEGLPMLTQFATEAILTIGTLFDEIKRIFDMLWQDAARPVLQLITKMWTDLMHSLKSFWDKWGHPIFEKFRTAIQTTGELFRKVWQKFLKPVFDVLMDTIEMLWDDHLKPLLDNILDLVGTVIDAALDIYNHCIAPIVGWLIDFLGPKVAAVINFIVGLVGNAVGGIIDVVNDMVKIIKGIVEFIAGVFTGDWKRAWNGIKDIFKNVWNALVDIVKVPLNLIIGLINGLTNAIESAVNFIIDCLNELSWEVPDWVPIIGGETFGFDIDNIEIPDIPYLAKGTVVPANYGEFLAVLGDNKRETEVVSPVSTIKQAVREVIGENGGSSPKEIVLYTYLYPNSAAFHREVIKIVRTDESRKGR